MYSMHRNSPPNYPHTNLGTAGLGLQGASTVIPYVRLDMDNSGKGIHFNATQRTDTNKKLAAVLDYLKGIENRSAEFIWQWWSTGIPPS
ncbi:hypothetical protein L210DRAFT_3537437 [Boletus edulis BED1]|uniref:Uncharacterized protein n=1 Tax=Boletus edulis BED1 TaxID=1328754 RepID=A0AAD4BAN9_BOLED|nr:hypothetical protein L210DRAFT_3589293 [Boletus edulis BED1]KAF8441527.1 hypothetical protein L210DRAFT_3537437 [Boletus edulis BED1]